jgi:hypothetical protein
LDPDAATRHPYPKSDLGGDRGGARDARAASRAAADRSQQCASKDEIVELFIHLEAYAGAARAFDSYQVAAAVFAEQT